MRERKGCGAGEPFLPQKNVYTGLGCYGSNTSYLEARSPVVCATCTAAVIVEFVDIVSLHSNSCSGN